MGTITGQAIVDRAKRTLIDEGNTFWTEDEQREHLAAGINAICAKIRSAYVVNRPIQLVEGTLQVLPDEATSLIDVRRNLGTDGLTPGRAIRQTDMHELDRANPNWHTGKQSYVVREYAFDDRDPKRFYVNPPMDFPPTYVEVVYSAVPERVTDLSKPIPIDDVYEDALYFYVLAMAYAKNLKRGDLVKADSYMAKFRMSLGDEDAADKGIEAIPAVQEVQRP